MVFENDVHFTKTIDVSDYKMDFTGPNHDTSNILTYNVALIVPPEHEGEVTIYPHDSVALNVYFKDVILDYAQGFFGQELFMFGPQTQELQILEDLQLNKLSLGESEIKLHITNTYGVDVNTQLLDLIATNTHTQESILLESDLLNTDLWIGRAQETNVYDSIIPYEASFDFSQSNLAEMISILPDKLNFFLNIETNVGADSTETNDFVYLNKPMSVQLQAKVNGGVSFDHLFQSAQMQWNGQGLNLEKIESGHLKLIFDNAMPFSFIMNLYLENEEKEIIDTLVFERNITAGIIGNENFVVESTRSYEEIPINESLKNSLAETKYSTYDLWISSANGEQIQIHKNNYLQFKVIGDFTYLMEQ
ncbi:MAG: hypothetical protein B7C24_15140 [Bacteroidetes bacterium 4572_77]|nr:MAG: hypothetical protein B7C24_15140 [Bacteroidetes bacterium 4572_77]